MRKPLFHSLAAALLLATSVRSLATGSSTQSDLEKEYAQVRKIALKDPKVQEAFSKADERLNEKIIEIDPSLKPIVERQTRVAAPVAVVTPRPKSEPRSAAASTPQGHEHIVLKGETLGSIAAHYNVKVASLEKVNHITDARKLQVGQKLVIPGPESIESQPAAESQTTPSKDNGGLWDRIKSNL